MKVRLFIFGRFAHDSQGILAAVWAPAFLLAYLVWDFAVLVHCNNATAHTSCSNYAARLIGDTERKIVFRHVSVSHGLTV
jgi:hypothetical protein